MLLASDAERTRENCWCLTAVAYYLQPIWEHHLLDDSSGTLRCAVSFWGKITFFHLLCELAQFIKWTIHKDRITFPSVNALLLPKKARRRKKNSLNNTSIWWSYFWAFFTSNTSDSSGRVSWRKIKLISSEKSLFMLWPNFVR